MTRHFVGVDLGQARDFTALAVVERWETQGEWDAAAFGWRKTVNLNLRHLERMALGTPYPEVVERVTEVTRRDELAGRCQLVVDATGVGRPVVDLLRRSGPGCRILPAVITGGEREGQEGGYYRVPKRDLISGLQVLLQTGRLRIASGLKHGPTLAAEMAEMKIKVSPAGKEQFGAWREGSHDDLVFAVALACWGVRKMFPGDGDARWRRQGRIV